MADGIFGYTIFCDDIRFEVNGKRTLVGAYNGDMQFPLPPPARLMQLGVSATLMIPSALRAQEISFRLSFVSDGSDETHWEGQMSIPKEAYETPPRDIVAKLAPESGSYTTPVLETLVRDIEITRPGIFKMRADVDGQEIKMGALLVLFGDAESDREQPS